MNMNDMVVISVDDHVSEPPDMFDKHLSGEALASAPKMRTTGFGHELLGIPGHEDAPGGPQCRGRARARGIRHGADFAFPTAQGRL